MKSQIPVVDNILSHLYEPDWFKDIEHPSLHVRVYSIVNLTWEKLQQLADSVIRSTFHKQPIKFLLGEIKDLEFINFEFHFVSEPSGRIQVQNYEDRRVLPHSSYLIVSTPHEINEIDSVGNIERTTDILDRIAAILRMNTGNNFLKDLMLDSIVNPKTGEMKSASEILRLPFDFEGPFLEQPIWEEFEELMAAINAQSGDLERKIGLSLELFEKGANPKEVNKFFYYWVGLELVCNTHKPFTIKKQLASHYDQDISFVINVLGFDHIYELRNKYFHNGIRLQLSQKIERYIQCLFFDLLRCHLKLPCNRHMEKMIEQGSITLRDIENSHFATLNIVLP